MMMVVQSSQQEKKPHMQMFLYPYHPLSLSSRENKCVCSISIAIQNIAEQPQ